MKFLNYLNEISTNEKLIICDIQPEYHKFIKFKLSNFTQWINKTKFSDILVLYNGEYTGMTENTKNDVIEYYIENGLSDESIDLMTFIDKGYGFLRNWMDNNIQENLIIEVLNYMEKMDLRMSTDIEKSYFMSRWPRLKYEYDNPINFPENLEKTDVKPYTNSTIIGGGKNECLAELQILFKHWNIKTKEFPRYIY